MARRFSLLSLAAVALFATLGVTRPALAQNGPLPPMTEQQKQAAFDEAFALGLEAIREQKYARGVRLFSVCIRLYPERPTAYYNLACIHSLQNDVDASLKSLRQALEKGFNGFEHVERDGDLDNVRQDPRFKTLIAEFRKKLLAGAGDRATLVGATDRAGAPLVVWLHGSGDTAESWKARWDKAGKSAGVVVMLVESTTKNSRRSWDGSTETVVVELVRKTLETGRFDRSRVIMAGYSEGAIVAQEIALHHSELFRGLVSFNGAWDPELGRFLDDAKARKFRAFLTTGRRDPLLEKAREGRDALAETGIPTILKRFRGGHRMPAAPGSIFIQGLKWVLEGKAPKARKPRVF